MINTSISVWLGIIFVLTGAINVWLILQASARVRDAKGSARLIAAHRIGGYFFIALFCVMGYFMVFRLGAADGSASSSTIIHFTLAMILSPLIFIKVLVARYYKSYYSFLLPIGLVIFVLSFVLVGITAGPYLAHRPRMQTVSFSAIDMPPAAIDMNLAAATMEKRCSKCHNLDRVAGARKDAKGWLATVNRMRALPDSGISLADSTMIVSYLASRMAPGGSVGAGAQEVARALIDQRCGRCHSLDRVYKTAETPEEWTATVARMVSYAAGSSGAIQPGEDQQIIAYLSATQTPDAVNRRQAQAAAAPAAGGDLVRQKAPQPEPSAPGSGNDVKTIGFISLVCLGLLTLIVRRPARTSSAQPPGDAPVERPREAPEAVRIPAPGRPLILRLARITAQTHDAKTLRFVVADDSKLNARPGQFLTFSFLFDGKKVVRSYTICSSPVAAGYVEITPKRMGQGCASIFLHDQASVGMTVEASGPFGTFCFDPAKHQRLVLLAAGSGITPMMAMLRYMDDLCLPTPVTLLYCVRTIADIIFESELEQLRARLKSMRYDVLLSQPHAEWYGPRGHITRDFIAEKVGDLAASHFFLCGPPAFMQASRDALTALGVKPERILQESFGAASKKAQPEGVATEASGVVVDFARSGKTCTVRTGQTLLEAAEEQGVTIPFSCRQGQCGTCKTRLLAGNVQMDAEVGLDPDSRAEGFVLTCVGRPDGPVRLDA